jgi:nucleotide-binding universal stress UspA family protein
MRLGVEICRFFEARLLLFHNLDGLPPAGMGVGWMWSEEHQLAEGRRGDDARRRLHELLEEIPAGIHCEGKVARGTLDTTLPQTILDNDVDLVVMGTHGVSSADHRSATESFIAHAPCPVLTIRERALDMAVFDPARVGSGERFPVLVPLDFADYSLTATAYAFELARLLPIELHLLHAEAPSGHLLRKADPDADAARLDSARAHLEALVPGDLEGRVTCHVVLGTAGEEILASASSLGARLIVMGVHEKGFLERWTAGAPSRDALFGSPCPVLYVSAVAAEALRAGADNRAQGA